MNIFFLFLAALIPDLAFSEAPKLFDADPICDSVADFKKELDKARPAHRSSPLLRAAVSAQDKWFAGASGAMASICAADKKFAAYLLAKERGKLTGQCKPAEEAATYDQEMLEHSESNLKSLQLKKDELLTKGIRGVTESLPVVADRNVDLIDDLALDLRQVDLRAYCELRWLYPARFLAKLQVGVVEGCPALEQFNNAAKHDKNDPSVFSKLLHRFDLSITYNTARRNKASEIAKASRAAYLACVAQNPEVKAVPILGGKPAAAGQGTALPKARSPRGSSDITGTEEEKKKQLKSP